MPQHPSCATWPSPCSRRNRPAMLPCCCRAPSKAAHSRSSALGRRRSQRAPASRTPTLASPALPPSVDPRPRHRRDRLRLGSHIDRLQWPPRLHAFVIAVASLSNYVGGAAGTVAMPLIADDAASLLHCLRMQAFLSVPLVVGMASWLYLPEADASHSAGGAPRTACSELRRLLCPARCAGLIVCYGVEVGVSLALQGAIQRMLTGMGFSALEAGIANTCYQFAAAAAGVALSGRVRSARALPPMLRIMHLAAAAAYWAVVALGWRVDSAGRFGTAPALLLAASAALGVTLLGMLPFLLQHACHEIPASQTAVSGAGEPPPLCATAHCCARHLARARRDVRGCTPPHPTPNRLRASANGTMR